MTTTRWSVSLVDHAGVVAPSPDGQLVAAGSLGGDAVVIDTRDGEVLAKLADHPMGVLAAAWSPEGRHLAVGGQDGVLRLYRRDGTLVTASPVGGWVTALAWSPDGLLATGAGRAVVVVDTAGHTRLHQPDQLSTVTAVAWSADASRVGVAAYGGIRWYAPGEADAHLAHDDAEGPVRTFDWKGSLLSLAVSPTGKWACAGSQDATVHIWRLWSGKELSMSGYPTKIEHLAFRHDGRWLAVGCADDLTIWDFGGRGPSGTKPARGEGHDGLIGTLAWQPAGDRLATGGTDGRLMIWPSPTRPGRTLKPLTVHQGTAAIAGLAWTPSGDGLVVGDADGQVARIGSPDGD